MEASREANKPMVLATPVPAAAAHPWGPMSLLTARRPSLPRASAMSNPRPSHGGHLCLKLHI